jgi:hypothetical protein
MAANPKFRVNPELLRQLAQTGSPVDLAVLNLSDQLPSIEVEQMAGVHDSKFFETEVGVLGFMAYLAVTNVTTKTIQVAEVELRAPLVDNLFRWLPAVDVESKSGRRYSLYRFPGRCGLEFQAEHVLNHVLLEQGFLAGKRRLEGWLLGVGGMMPAGLTNGSWLEVPVAVIASDHVEYTTELQLYTERLTTRPKRKPRRSLFDPAEQTQDRPLMQARSVAPAPIRAVTESEASSIREEKNTGRGLPLRAPLLAAGDHDVYDGKSDANRSMYRAPAEHSGR